MGRVEEAMRRAAEGRTAVAPMPADGEDVHPGEPFPDEGPEAARVSRAEAPAPAWAADHVERSETAEAFSFFQRLDGRLAEKVVVDQNMMPASREQYRRLGAALHHAQAANGLKVVLIASAVSGEGKTLTASNLALTLSESYQRSVLLIDADLRKPSLHTLFKIKGTPGLGDGLKAPDDPKLPLHQVSSRLTILPAGRPSNDPMAGLTSERMRLLLEEARDVFDWVIIDTPPVGLLTDANLLSAMADGALLVVRAGSTPYDLVQRAVDALGRNQLLGVVLNQAATTPHGQYDYNYYYGSQLPAARRK